ncbi:flagellar motor protein MotB [Nitrospinota bacterium]
MSDEGPDPDAWLVTFGDLITLLLTFFVLMLSMSSMDKKRVEEAFEHFGGSPFLLEGGSSPVIGPPTETSKSAAAQIQRGMNLADQMKKVFSPDMRGEKSPMEVVLDATGEVRIIGDRDGQTIVFSGSFLFHPGSTQIRIGAFPLLDGIAKVLSEGDEVISVEGHTDSREMPMNPKYKDRWDLSAARAVNVLKYLIQKGKISGNRLSAVGYGESRPVKPNEKEADRLSNRRVEIVIANNSDSNS